MAGASRDATTEEIVSWFCGSGPNRVGDFCESENPRGGREGNHQRRERGRIGWLSVIVKVQAISEWESVVEQKRGGTVRAFGRPFFVAEFDAHSVGYFVVAGMIQKNWMV